MRLRNTSFSRMLSSSARSRALTSVMSVLEPTRCTDPSSATRRLLRVINCRTVPSRWVTGSSISLTLPVTTTSVSSWL